MLFEIITKHFDLPKKSTRSIKKIKKHGKKTEIKKSYDSKKIKKLSEVEQD